MPEIPNEATPEAFFLNNREIAQMIGCLHANRRIMITGYISDKSMRRASLELIKLDFESNDPITLIIESEGGSLAPAKHFFDAITMVNSPVDAIAMGDCSSVAVDLLQVCRKRMLLPSTRLLIHYIRNTQRWIADDLERLEADIEHFRRSMRDIKEERHALYAKRTGLSEEKLFEIFRYGETHSAFFSAKQAVELNLADEIVLDFKLFPKKT